MNTKTAKLEIVLSNTKGGNEGAVSPSSFTLQKFQ